MNELEITISDLQDIAEILINNGYGGWAVSIGKAISLLKEQEPVPVSGQRYCRCGNCGVMLFEGWKYCAHCGKEIDWSNK